jgi:hypothetical protein
MGIHTLRTAPHYVVRKGWRFSTCRFHSVPKTVAPEHYILTRAGLKPGEADQVGANTETGTRAGGRADRRGVDVEDGEDS